MDEYKHYQKMDVPVTSPPSSVVSLVPSLTESLFDLNLGSRVIAVTDYCVRPAEKVARLPKVGGTKNPDVQRIIALHPELVIANQEENRKEDVEALQAAGIPVWVTFPKTVREAMNLLWNIMYLFEETSMVPRVRVIEQSLDWVEAISLAKEDKVCKVFAPIWLEPLMTFNADTYAHDLLRVCGGTNVFAERARRYPLAADIGQQAAYAADDPRVEGRDTRYPRVTFAEVEAAQPDVILLPSEPFEFKAEHVSLFAKLDCPAARRGKIHLIDGALLTWHGTRLAYALNELPALMCSDDGDAV
jgi:ABC-type Fe3+-hydroxamate transport system substrate-binding protein